MIVLKHLVSEMFQQSTVGGRPLRILAGFAICTTLFVSSVSAAIITQTVTLPAVVADVTNRTATFNLFQSAGAPVGSILTGVTLQFVITESLTSLVLTNTSVSSQVFRFVQSAAFDAGDSQNGVDATALSNALISANTEIYNSGFINISGLGTFDPGGYPRSLTGDTGMIIGTTASYAGAGTFDLLYSTLTSSTITGGGGNIQSMQTTTTNATATVIYTYSPAGVPEPSSMLLLGGGLGVFVLLGRKRMLR